MTNTHVHMQLKYNVWLKQKFHGKTAHAKCRHYSNMLSLKNFFSWNRTFGLKILYEDVRWIRYCRMREGRVIWEKNVFYKGPEARKECGRVKAGAGKIHGQQLVKAVTSLWVSSHVSMCSTSFQSCPTICDRRDCSPPGSSVHGVLQARIWSGLPCLPSGDLPNMGTEPASLASPALAGGFFTTSVTWESRWWAHKYILFFRSVHLRFNAHMKHLEILLKMQILFRGSRMGS